MTQPQRTPRFDYLARLEANIQRDRNGCWVWQKSCFNSGYARWYHRGLSTRYAHRIAYELLIGPVPPGLEVDHLCRNRACVNPDHLEPVTHAENVRRAAAATPPQAHCRNGHAMSRENTYVSRAQRHCRQCNRDAQARRRARKRARVNQEIR